jgi:PPOX class probable F420-dependent enzyme
MMDELEARHRVATARVARLATTRADGRPHIVPVCFALDGDTLVSVVDGKPKRSANLLRLANVRAHPAVTVLVDHYDDDWTRLWWVRLDGVAEVVVDGAEHMYAIALLEAKYPQYRAMRPTGAVMRVTVAGWTGWEAAARGI